MKHSHDTITSTTSYLSQNLAIFWHWMRLHCFSLLLTLLIWSKFSFIYKLKNGNENNNFRINETSGSIITAASLDQDPKKIYHLRVVAEKCHKGLVVVEVILLDKNYSKPKFENIKYYVNVPEDASINQHLITVCFFFNNLIKTQPHQVLWVLEFCL